MSHRKVSKSAHLRGIIFVVAILLASFAASSKLAAQTVTVETLRQLVAAFNRHDLDAVMSFFADDCVLEMPRGPQPWGQRYVGKAEVRKGLASRFEGLPDVHYSDDEHWVFDDRAVSQWTLTGTTKEGRKIRVRGCDLLQFRNGKIIRKDSYWKIVE
jgi:ketosteroid isomerase-like protein